MKLRRITDLQTPIGEILKVADACGVVVQSDDQKRYAVFPLDDERVDFLLERNQKFIEECEQIHQRMMSGESYSQGEVERLLTAE